MEIIISEDAKGLDKDADRRRTSLLQQLFSSETDRILEEVQSTYPAAFSASLEHTAKQIAAVPVVSDPFPHLVVDDLLADDFFRILLKLMPDDNHLRPQGRKRREVRLTPCDSAFNLLRPAQMAAWLFYSDVIFRMVVMPGLIDKFHDALAAWYRELSAGAITDPVYTLYNPRLIWAGRQYELDPHVDVPHMGLVCITYFTPLDDTDDPALGTQLYHGAPLKPVMGKTNYAKTETSTAVAVPFRPNRMLVFLNGPAAYHGASIPDAERYTAGRVITQMQVGVVADQVEQVIAAAKQA